MNHNIVEIGHLAFRIKDEGAMDSFYKDVLGLHTGFILKNKKGEDRIVYYQLNHGQFLEVFPENSDTVWNDYDGQNKDELYSYQYAVLGNGEGKEAADPEGSRFFINDGPKYITKVKYHVKDLDASVSFYTNVIGMDLAKREGNTAWIRVNDTQLIELVQHAYAGNNCTSAKAQCHYALIVKDIVKFYEQLKDKNVQIWNGGKEMNHPYTSEYVPVKHSENSYNFYIVDPDDNDIEVMQYSEDSLQLKYAAE